jgi:hypothetical protein
MGTTCPKCKYTAVKPHDTLILKGECPRCGLVLSKYHQQHSAPDGSPSGQQEDLRITIEQAAAGNSAEPGREHLQTGSAGPEQPQTPGQQTRGRYGSSAKAVIIIAAAALIVSIAYVARNAPPGDTDNPGTRLIAASSGDISAYAEKVREARSTEGDCFPEAESDDRFSYYRKVYLDTGEPLGTDLDSILAKYLPLYLSRNTSVRCDQELELLLFNAMCFRQQLIEANMIQNDTWKKLRNAATAWGDFKAGLGEGEPAYRRLIRGFDAQCPFCDPEELLSPVPADADDNASAEPGR